MENIDNIQIVEIIDNTDNIEIKTAKRGRPSKPDKSSSDELIICSCSCPIKRSNIYQHLGSRKHIYLQLQNNVNPKELSDLDIEIIMAKKNLQMLKNKRNNMININ